MEPFPWHLGVFDAHCHPTDTMASIASIPEMKASTLTIMATRGEDQDLIADVASKLTTAPPNTGIENVKVVPCFGWHPWFSHQIQIDTEEAGSTSSAAECSDISSQESAQIKHYRSVLLGSSSSYSSKAAAAESKPHITPVHCTKLDAGGEDAKFFQTLPKPKPLSELLMQTRTRLLKYPNALVGEIGLDKAFRLPIAWSSTELADRDAFITPGSREGRTLSPYRVSISHQKNLLKAQLLLAGELGRPVSVHSVQAHGAVVEVLQDIWKGHERNVLTRKERKRQGARDQYVSDGDKEDYDNKPDPAIKGEGWRQGRTGEKKPLPFPPRICMHSYSGPVEALNQLVSPRNPSDVYFSFSSAVNFKHGRYGELENISAQACNNGSLNDGMRRRRPEDAASTPKVVDVICAVPADRLLVESDLHCAGEEMDDLLEDIGRWICEIRGWPLEGGVKQLGENYKRFAYG